MVHLKMDDRPSGFGSNLNQTNWMNDENTCCNWDSFSIARDLVFDLLNGHHSLSLLAMCDTWSSLWFLDKSIVSTKRQNVFVRSRKPRNQKMRDGKSADNYLSTIEGSTIDNSEILYSWEFEVERPDCSSARVERSLPTIGEPTKSELESKKQLFLETTFLASLIH